MLMKCMGSGSSGNGYALISDDEILLIECGISAKEMLRVIDYQTGKVAGCLRQEKLLVALSLMSMVKETMQSISSST